MEPLSYPRANPGKGALLVRMNKDELIRQFEEDIHAVPYAIGVNNHMGSRFMTDEEGLKIVLDEIRKKQLFFIDSMTTSYSKGELVARITGVPCLSRNIFIDNSQNYDATLRILLNLASGNKQDHVVVIGHPYHSTILALKEAVPRLKRSGVKIVPVSDLLPGGKDAFCDHE